MFTVTFFAPKGGTGRTTALMVLASGLMSLGYRVAIVDASDEVGPSWSDDSSLYSWYESVERNVLNKGRSKIGRCGSVEQLRELHAQIEDEGYNFLLVDTAQQPDETQLQAAYLSDVIISPLAGALEARGVSKGFSNYVNFDVPVLGIATNLSAWAEELDHIRSSFSAGSLMKTELPFSNLLRDPSEYGRLSFGILSTPIHAKCLGNELRHWQLRELRHLWRATMSFTLEVYWWLHERELQVREPAELSYAKVSEFKCR